MRRSVFDRPAQWIQRAGVVALFMTLVLSAFTGSAHGKVFGYGNKVCLEYVEVFDNQDVRSLYASWAQGYFSSISHREGMSDFTRGIGEDPNAMQKWLKRYCERRNSKKFYEAVDAYAEELIKFGAQKTR